MFEFGIYLFGFKDAADCRIGIAEAGRSGFLPDGSDMEQSFNYNKGLPKMLSVYLSAVDCIPPSHKLRDGQIVFAGPFRRASQRI